jgi:iron complex outermembrane receptor protein
MRLFRVTAILLLASSLCAANAAFAQSKSTSSEPASSKEEPALGVTLQEVTVSASAITMQGYDQPTPVTSLGNQQIQSAAQPDISDLIRALPAFGGSSSPENSTFGDFISRGQAGWDLLDLRGLGPNRTLVLIDGQRLVDGSIYGGEDVGSIPSSLVERVDVVTGGASAIWGSDAVAGVVNYVLNHNFNGVKFDIEGSNNNQNAHPQYKLDLTAGTGFDDDRGHIEASASAWQSPQVYYTYQTQGYAGQWLVNNPACNLTSGKADPYTGLICPQGQSPLVHGTNVGAYGATPGGIIDGCLNASGAASVRCTLMNTYFVGPNATPMNFNPGNVSNGYLTNGGTPNTVENDGGVKGAPITQITAFMLSSYKINDRLKATLQFDYGGESNILTAGTGYVQTGNATIYSGNPFIPAATQSQMTAQGVGALAVGTTNTNPFTGPAPNLTAQAAGVGMEVNSTSRRMMRGVFGLDGDINDDWKWNAYYEISQTHQSQTLLNMPVVQNIYNAEDAVTVGSYSPHYTAAAYPNPLGLSPGTITCLSNLLPAGAAGRTTNCAPLNIFGSGPGIASQEAIQYIDGIARSGGDHEDTNITQNVAAATVQGKLPFGTSAGRIALAAGVVHRSEVGVTVNCGADCNNAIFDSGNFSNFYGNYHVNEGSLELNAPLLKDQGVQDLSVDAAYRAVDYSTSGFVSTYKFGVVSQLTDAVRLRASYSVDIRAGDLQEEFQTATTNSQEAVDPRTGNTLKIQGVSEGNQQILPEKAKTLTAGFVLTPFGGLTSSLDFYSIRIDNVIASVGGSQVSSLCRAGYSAYCEELIFGSYPNGCSGPTLSSCPQGAPLAAIINKVQNIDSESTSGIDFLADYRVRFMGGTVDLNANANYVFAFDYTHLGITCDPANGLGPDQANYPSCVQGNPKFRGTVALSYAQGNWVGTVQTRFIGATHLVTQWASNSNEVDNNNIPFYTYLDLRLSYQFESGIQLYSAIDNVANRIPPVFPPSAYSGSDFYLTPLRDDIYDGYGRVWRLGLRAKF